MVIKATYYGANGWLVDLNETRILIDPWLKGDLTFPPGDWLIKGELDREIEIPIDIDFLEIVSFCLYLFLINELTILLKSSFCAKLFFKKAASSNI